MIDYRLLDDVCLLRLDAPPVNAFTLELLDELRGAIARANADGAVRGIVLTGEPGHFSAGVDLNLFRQITSADKMVEISRAFQEAFAAVEASAKPVAAAVAGKVMGGALELAAACHGRFCDAASRFVMPEVKLGISPGAGGTQRLPRLIGLAAALRMLLTAEPIDAVRAAGMGLVDEVCDAGDLVSRAAAWVRTATASGRRTAERTDRLGNAAARAEAFAQAEQLLKKIRPEIVAPREITEAVRTGLDESFQAGLLAEQGAIARCMATPAASNRIYLFFATRGAAKADLGPAEPRKIARAAVIGMGSMGTGIAQAIMTAGVPVVLFDENPAAIERGIAHIRQSLEKRVETGRLASQRAAEMLSLLRPSAGPLGSPAGRADTAQADLAIEAVYEAPAVKRSVLRALAEACRENAVIATNTSTLSLDALADGLAWPGRLIGMHFFNPAHRMPLLEVIRGRDTAEVTIATTLSFARALGKTAVLVRNREGFVVNRLFVPYIKEAFALLAEGADAEAIDAAMVEFGFPMGPLTLIDMAGIDILMHADAVLAEAFSAHGPPPAIAVRLVEAGMTGQKAGAGVYRYVPGDYAPHRNADAERIIAEVRGAAGVARPAGGMPTDEIVRRLVLRMVAEAFGLLADGIVQRESDIDVAMVLGIGFPDFRGGVLRYAREMGLKNVMNQLGELAARLGERYAPCALLRQMEGVQ